MITYCSNCGKKIEANALFCTYCGAENSLCGTEAVLSEKSSRQTKKRIKFKLLCTLGIIAVIVIILTVLNANLLLPWQRGARINKQVILEYAEEHYPDAQVIEGHYNSAKFFVWNHWGDAIVFNLNDIEFKITAEAGEILIDGYPEARACEQFNKIIQDGFFEPRGLSVQTDYIFADNYYEIYPYTGELGVSVKIIDQGSTPREVGGLYDFYKFWEKEGAFLTAYSVQLSIIEDNRMMYLDYNYKSEFPDEASFYAAFKVV